MRALLTTLLLVFAALAAGQSLGEGPATTLGGFSEPEFLPVEKAYRLTVEVSGPREIRLDWQIEPGYYLYQHNMHFDLRADGEAIPAGPEFPPALEREDEYFGKVKVYYDYAGVALEAKSDIPPGAQLAVTYQGCADAGLCYPPRTEWFSLDPAAGIATPIERPAANAAPEPAWGALPYMLLLAFLGGSILNLMPCVFPILSLKVLKFARSTDHDRHLHSWLYTLGVVASFVAVATVLMALQQAGRAVGWGFQLQSTGFVVALAYLFLAMGLALSGVVQLGGGLMNVGQSLTNHGGLAASFFTGVLAAVVASPCTAPFMGTALGFAVTQPPAVGLAVFAALGFGMATPLLLFGYSGAARKLMPAPGPWMEVLKQFLAFPLYGAAVWLLWVAGKQTGVNTMAAILAGALALSLALWLWNLGHWRRVLALLFALLAIALGSVRNLDVPSANRHEDTVAWSEQRLAQLRREGSPVFVDVTADWCITCLANEKAVLLTEDTRNAFARHGVVYMVADWTNYDPAIAGFISRYGRTGIPLYLLYPADPSAQPLVLPQILTQDTIFEALSDLSGKKP